MSTGLDCQIVEIQPNEWYYELEQYGNRDMYDVFGPFPTDTAAEQHIHDHQANPGGWCVTAYNPEYATSDDKLEAYRKAALKPQKAHGLYHW